MRSSTHVVLFFLVTVTLFQLNSRAYTSFIFFLQIISELLKLAADPEHKFKYDMYDIAKLKEVQIKVRESIPHKFKDLIENVKNLLMYMEKYCLSFYDIEAEDQINYGTAYDYEKKRRDIMELVNDRMQVGAFQVFFKF